MLRTIIIEDEIHILNMMHYFMNENKHYKLVGTFSNPLEALKEAPLLNADVLFIDIEMPMMNGIELAKRLKTAENQVVFTTAYEHYALEAFRIQATDYLLKPVTPEDITAITNKLMKIKEVNRLMQVSETKPNFPLIQCFGTFKVINYENTLLKWPTRKTEELLAYLLTHQQQSINKWRIADMLWPEKDGEKALHSVHNTVYLLKKTLKEYNFPIRIDMIHDGYTLLFEQPIFSDFYSFQQLDANTELMEPLLNITNQYSLSGSLFSDKDYNWSIMLREELNMKHKGLLRKLITYYTEQDTQVATMLEETYMRLYKIELE